jgi:hypothetical protein
LDKKVPYSIIVSLTRSIIKTGPKSPLRILTLFSKGSMASDGMGPIFWWEEEEKGEEEEEEEAAAAAAAGNTA